MKQKIFIGIGLLALLGCLISVILNSPKVHASDAGWRNGLYGTYAAQFTGTIFLPAPFDKSNGPFALQTLVSFDGNGNFKVLSAAHNYSGVVTRDLFAGTYTSNYDGTFTLKIPNYPAPFLPPGTPNVFSMDGIITAQGESAKLMLTSVSAGGQVLPNGGSVITGELVRQ